MRVYIFFFFIGFVNGEDWLGNSFVFFIYFRKDLVILKENYGILSGLWGFRFIICFWILKEEFY